MTRFILALVILTGLPGVALAEVPREIGQAELRRMVSTGQSLSLSRVIDVVARTTAGEPVDVRLFDSDGLYYRVVVVQPSGRLLRLVMDAHTGEILPGNSPTATRLRAAATEGKSGARAAATTGKTNAKAGQGNSGSAGGNGAGGGNGRGNGNSGRSGNGGGNGNGNGKN